MKLRVRFRKTGYIKLISHLELLKLMERSLRRAHLPLSFTKGYNPRPIISFALPLPVGIEAENAYMEVELDNKIDTEDFVLKSGDFFPDGIEIISADFVETKEKLMAVVNASEYEIKCEPLPGLFESEKIEIEKKGKRGKVKTVNVLSHVLEYEYTTDGFRIILESGSVSNLSPMLFLKAIAAWSGRELYEFEVRRLRVFRKFDNDGSSEI